MGRKLPNVLPAVPIVGDTDRRGEHVLKSYNISLVTPIFGGGVEAGVNDPITLIRASSIRGQLRFWWRATEGRGCNNAEELLEREGALWGNTDSPSPVTVRVEIVEGGKEERCAEYPPDKNFPRFAENYPPYALFPFQGSKKDGTLPGKARRGVKFALELTYPKEQEESVCKALKAWVNFGGIGARTRRGCGAMFCPELSVKNAAGLNDLLENRSHGNWQWPVLGSKPLSRQQPGNPMRVWSEVIEVYKSFRQGPGPGRNDGTMHNRPGRSRWPEADALRRITKSSDRRHSVSITGKGDVFPRAEFGLPIVFHFKDKEDSPNDCEAYPQGGGKELTRWASPLILKPLALAENSAVPLMLRLATETVTEVRLKFGRSVAGAEKPFPTRNEASWPVDLKDVPPNSSALERFLEFAKRKGYKEI